LLSLNNSRYNNYQGSIDKEEIGQVFANFKSANLLKLQPALGEDFKSRKDSKS
jgi:hypothetical protein